MRINTKITVASGFVLAALTGLGTPSVGSAAEPPTTVNESGAPTSVQTKDIVPVTLLPADHHSVVGEYIDIKFDCETKAPGHPYLVFDRTGMFQPVTYNTGDGTPLGIYATWEKGPVGVASNKLFGGFTGATYGSAHRNHGSVTLYCAAHKEEANQ